MVNKFVIGLTCSRQGSIDVDAILWGPGDLVSHIRDRVWDGDPVLGRLLTGLCLHTRGQWCRMHCNDF